MTGPPDPILILSAEHFGVAEVVNGKLDIGGVKVPFGGHPDHAECPRRAAHVYVRRSSEDLSVMEIHIARHDGLAQEELDRQNTEADAHPLGPKEYWRTAMVGKYTMGPNGRLMTQEDFEADWAAWGEDEA